jgi:hypothetical protein
MMEDYTMNHNYIVEALKAEKKTNDENQEHLKKVNERLEWFSTHQPLDTETVEKLFNECMLKKQTEYSSGFLQDLKTLIESNTINTRPSCQSSDTIETLSTRMGHLCG